jgi:SAM-dependent methyltransferase
MFTVRRRSVTSRPWHEDDGFWSTLEPFFFSYFRNPASSKRETDQILDLLKPDPRADILDLCCGPGRITLELASRGFRVTGVDRTVQYLDRARAHVQERKLAVELVHQDARRFVRSNAFDIALNMLTSFGYFEEPDDDQKMLQNIHDSLRPGGQVLIDLMGKECLARDFQPRDWHQHPDTGHYLLEERTIQNDWATIETRWIVIRGNEQRQFTSRLRLYSARELADVLTKVGFSRTEVYGDLDGAPYDHAAQRLIAVATR